MQMKCTPEFQWDENLRDIPVNPTALEELVGHLKKNLEVEKDPVVTAKMLGEIGTYLRTLGRLDEAEKNLLQSLEIIKIQKLGMRKEIQQKIRLANVLQWPSF